MIGSELDSAFDPLPDTNPVPLYVHTGGCRWPIEIDGVTFFCADTAEDHVYCPRHRVMGTRQLPSPAGRKPRPKPQTDFYAPPND